MSVDYWIDRFILWVRDHPRTIKIPIGPDKDDPTYWRYFVVPRNRFFNVYLHHFRHSDSENLHDHRMANLSILLQGSYMEERFTERPIEGRALPPTHRIQVKRFIARRATTPHRVVLYRDQNDRDISMWSLFFGGPHLRNWGFWVPGGRWVPYTEVVSSDNPIAVGYGQRK